MRLRSVVLEKAPVWDVKVYRVKKLKRKNLPINLYI